MNPSIVNGRGDAASITMGPLSQCLEVLAQYPDDFRPAEVEPLGSAGGFSGSAIFRVRAGDRVFCLKRWPSEFRSAETLQWIHAVLSHVVRQGLDWVPAPCRDRSGRTFACFGDHFWELAPWMPGKADFHFDPRPERLRGAMTVLAEFHQAAVTLPDDASRRVRAEHALYAGSGPAPGVPERLDRVRGYLAGDLDQLARCIVPRLWPGLCDRAWLAVTLARVCLEPVRDLLEATRTAEVPLQPCIRDVWHDHVLFTGDRVTGLVDFDAMGFGSVAGDVARLLGSLAGDNASLWSTGLAAYHSLRPLSDAEQTLLPALDRSGVILAALNWVEWLYRERRNFPDAAAVANRLDELLPRLKTLSESPTGRSAAPATLWLPPPE